MRWSSPTGPGCAGSRPSSRRCTTGRCHRREILLLGGVDDAGMPVLRRRLADGGLTHRVAEGAVVLAVNAAYQVLGHTYVTPDGSPARRPRLA